MLGLTSGLNIKFKEFESIEIERQIQIIIDACNSDKVKYIEKFKKEWFIEVINNEKMKLIEQKFNEYDKNGVDVIDFCKIIMSVFENNSKETVYQTVCFVEIYKEVCEALGLSDHVKFSDVTNYIVENYIEKDMNNYFLPTKKIPEKKHIEPDPQAVREIDINPPVIYGKNNTGVKRLLKDKIITDRNHHNNQKIKCVSYSHELKKQFTLDSLSNHIKVYDKDCRLVSKIKPKSSKKNLDQIIINFAFSHKTQRIGASLKNFTLSFWDSSDNFTHELIINVFMCITEYQTNIWYLEYMDEWVTTDRTGALYSWDQKNHIIKESYDVFGNKFEKHKKNQMANKEKEVIKDNGNSDIYHSNKIILLLVEIEYLKLVAIATSDKQVSIFDQAKGEKIIGLNMSTGGVHQMKFFNSYQVLIIAGYENTLPVFSITPKYNDVNILGRLVGHQSQITCIEIIENTPMVLSADDSGSLKLWDIRTFTCLQTLDLGKKTSINSLWNQENIGRIAFIGNRVNYLLFDIYEEKKELNAGTLYPISAEFYQNNEELVVATRHDVRFIKFENGQTNKIFVNLVDGDEPDEITVFRLIQKRKWFVIGDHKGNVNIYHYNTGELVKKLSNHMSELSSLRIDYPNKLFITSSQDAEIKLQKELSGVYQSETNTQELEKQNEKMQDFIKDKEFNPVKIRKLQAEIDSGINKKKSGKNKNLSGIADNKKKSKEGVEMYQKEYEVLRTIEGAHFKKEILIMEISAYHNLIVTTSNDNKILFYNYEYFRVLHCVSLPEDIEPTAVAFLNGYSTQYIATNNGYICLINFNLEDATRLTIKISAIQDLHHDQSQKAQFDKHFEAEKSNASSDKEKISDVSDSESTPDSQEHRNSVNNENQGQKSAFYLSSKKNKKKQKDMQKSQNPKDPKAFCNKILLDFNFKKKKANLFHRVFANELNKNTTGAPINADEESELVEGYMYTCLSNGFIKKYQLFDHYRHLNIAMHCKKKANYNAFRIVEEKFVKNEQFLKGKEPLNIYKETFSDLNYDQMHEYFQQEFKAHKEPQTSISFIIMHQKYLQTTSQDCSIKVFTLDGQVLAFLNINHPLPIIWNIKYDSNYNIRSKIIFALKVLEIISQRYMKKNGEKGCELGEILKNFDPKFGIREKLKKEVQQEFQTFKMTQVELEKKILKSEIRNEDEKVTIMKDEYTSKDFAYDRLRKMDVQEFLGPSLVQLEAQKDRKLNNDDWYDDQEKNKTSLTSANIHNSKPVAKMCRHGANPIRIDNEQMYFLSETNNKKETGMNAISEFAGNSKLAIVLDKKINEVEARNFKKYAEDKLKSQKDRVPGTGKKDNLFPSEIITSQNVQEKKTVKNQHTSAAYDIKIDNLSSGLIKKNLDSKKIHFDENKSQSRSIIKDNLSQLKLTDPKANFFGYAVEKDLLKLEDLKNETNLAKTSLSNLQSEVSSHIGDDSRFELNKLVDMDPKYLIDKSLLRRQKHLKEKQSFYTILNSLDDKLKKSQKGTVIKKGGYSNVFKEIKSNEELLNMTCVLSKTNNGSLRKKEQIQENANAKNYSQRDKNYSSRASLNSHDDNLYSERKVHNDYSVSDYNNFGEKKKKISKEKNTDALKQKLEDIYREHKADSILFMEKKEKEKLQKGFKNKRLKTEEPVKYDYQEDINRANLMPNIGKKMTEQLEKSKNIDNNLSGIKLDTKTKLISIKRAPGNMQLKMDIQNNLIEPLSKNEQRCSELAGITGRYNKVEVNRKKVEANRSKACPGSYFKQIKENDKKHNRRTSSLDQNKLMEKIKVLQVKPSDKTIS